MDSILLDRAYAALMSGVEVNGWECIEPTRKWIPLAIQRKEAELVEAIEHLDTAAELNEQARTEVTSEALGEATKLVAVITAELETMREIYREHPEAFEDEGVI